MNDAEMTAPEVNQTESGTDQTDSSRPEGDGLPIGTSTATQYSQHDDPELAERILKDAGLIPDESAESDTETEPNNDVIAQKDAHIKNLEDKLADQGRILQRLDRLERGNDPAPTHAGNVLTDKPPAWTEEQWEDYTRDQSILDTNRNFEQYKFEQSQINKLVHDHQIDFATAEEIVKLRLTRNQDDLARADELYYEARKKSDEMRTLRDSQLTARNQGNVNTGATSTDNNGTATPQYVTDPRKIATELEKLKLDPISQRQAVETQAKLIYPEDGEKAIELEMEIYDAIAAL